MSLFPIYTSVSSHNRRNKIVSNITFIFKRVRYSTTNLFNNNTKLNPTGRWAQFYTRETCGHISTAWNTPPTRQCNKRKNKYTERYLRRVLRNIDQYKKNSPMLEVPAPTMLDVPARKSPTLDMSTQLAFLICSNSPLLRTLGCTASGPSNPHDPGPPAATAGRTVALIYIILPIIMTTIQFATYDYLRICPRSPQCFYVMYFLCSV